MPPDTSPISPPINSSFSPILPTLQTTVDSTSLGEFKTCPRKYYYRLVQGWVPRSESVHLTFGLFLHSALEYYDRQRALGLAHEEALRSTTHEVMSTTWNQASSRPWWSGHSVKNRLTLVRSVVWYLDHFGKDDPLQTLALANGQPAVELSFQFDSGFQSQVTDEPVFFCGHLDKIATLGSDPYVVDRKTTGSTLSSSYFAQYSPDNQFSMYTLAGHIAYETPVCGIICDAIQVAVNFSRFERQIILRSTDQVDEWLQDSYSWLAQMGRAAKANHWPMNDKACGMYGGCPYRPVCSRPPSARQRWLEADYTRSIWDPAQVREAT